MMFVTNVTDEVDVNSTHYLYIKNAFITFQIELQFEQSESVVTKQGLLIKQIGQVIIFAVIRFSYHKLV